MAVDTLGCGTYEVYFKTRGGDTHVGRVRNMTALSYARNLNSVSEGSVSFSLNGTESEVCCGIASTIEPWEHELAIYRNGEEIWCGPVVGGEVDNDAQTVTFNARDLSIWFSKRWVEIAGQDAEFEEVDIIEIYDWLIKHAYYKDPWNMEWFFTADRLNIPVDKTYIAFDPNTARWGGQYPMVENELADLRKSGVDYTTIRRVLIAGDLQSSTDISVRLSDNHWARPPKTPIIGLGMATEVGVAGGAGGSEGWDDDQIWIERPTDEQRLRYGLLQYFESAQNLDEESTVGTPNAIAQRAYGMRELKKKPYEYVMAGQLSPKAPLTFDTLIPGRYFGIDLQQVCRTVRGSYMLTAVNVTYSGTDEVVSVEMTPPGVESVRG